ncbi:hypothetical protein PCL_12685 [Purpureocillium lilacinum]|uniref:Uncharacterized protein n=1 Tax=Purpureocillium lilacinum TaxID=33203 RepID=A0A2U3DPB9_PURLI|nr:hypothetical protein PCL_12685 [Purpureocillium lilacinum]
MSLNCNHTKLQLQDAIGRCMYQIFTATSTSLELIQYGEEVLDWYENPLVTNDSDSISQLDTEAMRTIGDLRTRIFTAAAAIQHDDERSRHGNDYASGRPKEHHMLLDPDLH